MTSGFHVDTGQVAQTSQKAANSADTIISYFKRMDADTGNVLAVCRGGMFSALVEALTELQTQRDKLIPKLQAISEQLKQGGQGMDNQDQGGAGAIRGQVGLSTSINQPR